MATIPQTILDLKGQKEGATARTKDGRQFTFTSGRWIEISQSPMAGGGRSNTPADVIRGMRPGESIPGQGTFAGFLGDMGSVASDVGGYLGELLTRRPDYSPTIPGGTLPPGSPGPGSPVPIPEVPGTSGFQTRTGRSGAFIEEDDPAPIELLDGTFFYPETEAQWDLLSGMSSPGRPPGVYENSGDVWKAIQDRMEVRPVDRRTGLDPQVLNTLTASVDPDFAPKGTAFENFFRDEAENQLIPPTYEFSNEELLRQIKDGTLRVEEGAAALAKNMAGPGRGAGDIVSATRMIFNRIGNDLLTGTSRSKVDADTLFGTHLKEYKPGEDKKDQGGKYKAPRDPQTYKPGDELDDVDLTTGNGQQRNLPTNIIETTLIDRNGNRVPFTGTQAELDALLATPRFSGSSAEKYGEDLFKRGGQENLELLPTVINPADMPPPRPLLGGVTGDGQQTYEQLLAEMDLATDPFQAEEIRQLGYQQQTPFTAWTRLGLQGALTPDQTPTTDLSQFAQGAIQDYFGRTAEPEYAAALAAASRRHALGQDPGMQTGFEQFARGVPGQFGVGRVDPGRLGTDRDALIATLRDKTAMEDPYREELLSYLGDIEDPTNKRLLGALGRPTLGQVSPIYRAAARKRMEQRLQNLMAMKPEQTLLSFFAKGAPETRQDWMGMNPLNFETPGRIS